MALRACLVAGAFMVAMGGCGGDDDAGSATTVTTVGTPTAGPPTTERATTTAARATTTTTTEPLVTTTTTSAVATTTTTLAAGPLTGALLTAEEVGDGFVATRSADPDDEPETTTPCGTPAPDAVLGPGEQDSIDIDDRELGLFLVQNVVRYADEDTARQAMALGRAGVACGSGTSTQDDGTTVKFDMGSVEIPEPPADESFAVSGTVEVDGQTVAVVFVVFRDGRSLTSLNFRSVAGNQGPPISPIIDTAERELATVA